MSSLDALEARFNTLDQAAAKGYAEFGPKLKELEEKPSEEGWQVYRDALTSLERMLTDGRTQATQARTAAAAEQVALASFVPASFMSWYNFVVDRIKGLFDRFVTFLAEWWRDEATVQKLLKDRDVWVRIATHTQTMPKAVPGEEPFRYLKGSAGELVPLEWEGHVADIYYATIRQQALAVGHLAGLADMMPTAILSAANGALSIMASLGALVWRLVALGIRLLARLVVLVVRLFKGIRRILSDPREVGRDVKSIWDTASGKALWESIKEGGKVLNDSLNDIVMAVGNVILAIYAYLYGETVLRQQTEILRTKVALPVWEHSHDWPRPRQLAGRLWPTYRSVNGRQVLDIGGRTFDLPATTP